MAAFQLPEAEKPPTGYAQIAVELSVGRPTGRDAVSAAGAPVAR